MTGPVITTLDIETCPIEARVWSLWKQNVGLNQITQDWSILSFAAKQLGYPVPFYADNSKQKDVRDDSVLLEQLWHVLDATDIVIAQNGVKFDLPKINARFIQEGFEPYSPVKVVDTMLSARKIARFTSNKLEWLSKILTPETQKLKHEKFPGFDLWVECLKGNPEAWQEMREYNIQDIVATEEVYLKLRPWIEGHPNVAQFYEDDAMRCPRCGSDFLMQEEKPHYTQVGEYNRFRCLGCGGFCRDRYTINSKEKRRSLLTN